MDSPAPEIIRRVAELVDLRPDGWRTVGGGYTRSGRWLAATSSGRVFVKAGLDVSAAGALRREARLLETLDGALFAPQLLGFDLGDPPLLVLEDLSDAWWPPPYPPDTAPLFAALTAISITRPPDFLPALGDDLLNGWRATSGRLEEVAARGVAPHTWLDRHIRALAEAAESISLAGDALVHNDIWAGNICFLRERVLVVDWAEARRGNPALDIAMALLSLRVSAMPRPEIPLACQGAYAAALAGFLAAVATGPAPAWCTSPDRFAADCAGDAAHALAWAVDTLRSPPP